MPKEGAEFNSLLIDSRSSSNVAKMITYRYRKNGRTVDPVKIVERKITMVELQFSDDAWQPSRLVYHYGDETTWTA
jgi:hypothetical protein